MAVAVLLPDTGLIDDIVLAEDAYTQESRLLDPIVERLERRDLLLADRHYCISELLFEVDSRQACFVIRQHLGHLRWKLLGRRRSLGRTQSGLLYEQAVELTLPRTGEVMQVRRITVRLDQPTRNKDTELHVLTNLPEKHASAEQVAELYRRRWSIETAFQELTVSLRCELPSLGHPAAALFTFSVAAACFNVLAVIQAALAQAHDTQTIADEVSQYALAEEWTGTYRGMMIALPPEMWTAIQQWSPSELATQLIHWATTIDLSDYRKHQRGPKTRTKRPSAPTKHVATARLLKKQKPPPG